MIRETTGTSGLTRQALELQAALSLRGTGRRRARRLEPPTPQLPGKVAPQFQGPYPVGCFDALMRKENGHVRRITPTEARFS